MGAMVTSAIDSFPPPSAKAKESPHENFRHHAGSGRHLWPIAPVMEGLIWPCSNGSEQNCPEVAAALPIAEMRRLRDRTFLEHPELGHDFTTLRMLCLRAALTPYGYGEREVMKPLNVLRGPQSGSSSTGSGRCPGRLARRAPLVHADQQQRLSGPGGPGICSGADHGPQSWCVGRTPVFSMPPVPWRAAFRRKRCTWGDHPEQDVLGRSVPACMRSGWTANRWAGSTEDIRRIPSVASRSSPISSSRSKPCHTWSHADASPSKPQRLILRRLELGDAEFIFQLVNDPTWLAGIGDRGVRTLTDAQEYLRKGPLEMYERYGFGLYAIERKVDHQLIGICGCSSARPCRA